MDKHDISGAKLVVEKLCHEGIQWYRGNRSSAWENTYNSIRDGFLIHQSVDSVRAIFLDKNEDEINGPYILLAPPQNSPNIVCLLGVSWKLSDEQMGLYLNLFGQSNMSGVKTWHRGYRMELAHQRGNHGYTHVQPIRQTGRLVKKDILFTDQSVPDNFPSFPIRGSSLTTLCASLGIALDGKNMLGKIAKWLHGHKYQAIVSQLLSN